MRLKALLVSLGCFGLSSEHASATPPFELEATFASLDDVIFQPRCVSCHFGTAPAARIDLSTYDSMRAARTFPMLIKPLSASSSLLVEVVEKGSMPPGPVKLSEAEVNAVKAWINAGARRNETDPVPTPVPAPTEPPD